MTHSTEPWRTRALAGQGAALALAVLAAAPVTLAAQETPPEEPTSVDSLRARVDSLQALIQEMEARRRQQEQADDLEALRAAAEAAAAGVPEAEADPDAEFVGRQRSLQSLNPEISVTGDFFGFADPDAADQNNFIPREVEFAFVSALDPYSRAKVFISYHRPGGELIPFESEHGEEEEAGVEVEEAYVEWVGLPGRVGLKFGQFYQQLGILNRWHSHALSFQARSLPHLTFIGEENLGQAGLSARALLPIHGAGAYEVTFEVTRSSNELLYGESNRPSFLGHVNGFWQLSAAWDLDLGLSATGGPFRLTLDDVLPGGPLELEGSQFLYSGEFSLSWVPPARSRYRGFNLRGGVMARAPSGLAPLETAWGTWGWAEVRLGQQWLLGGRAEWVQDPADTGQSAWLVAPSLTWWQSEWVRLRTEVDHLDEPTGSRTLFVFQLTFAMGPHKHETY